MTPTYLVQLLWTVTAGTHIIDARTMALVKRWTKCQMSIPTMREVLDCPLDDMAYAERARQKNCGESLSCGGEKLVYHCLLNTWRNSTVEVCAPKNLITGFYCAHYNIGAGRVLEDYRHRCNECPYNYKSTSAHKYKSCDKAVKRTDQNVHTPAMPIQPSPNVFNKSKSTAAPCIKSREKRSSRRRRNIDCSTDVETNTAALSSSTFSSSPSLMTTTQATHMYHQSLTDVISDKELTITIFVAVGIVGIIGLAVACSHKGKSLPCLQPANEWEKNTTKEIDEQKEFLEKDISNHQNGV